MPSAAGVGSVPTTSDVVTRSQLSSLDDTDCYASVWEQILAQHREQQAASPSSNKQHKSLWGGKGRGGRGLARRTVQPHDVVVEGVTMKYLSSGSGSGSRSRSRSGKNTPEASLLEDATLKLLRNRVYCLVGRNGCGKSTLLKKIYAQKIPGWSLQWSSLYVPPALPPEFLEWTPAAVVAHYVEGCKRDSRRATESRISDLEARIDALDLTGDNNNNNNNNNENDNEEDDVATKMERLCEELSSLEDALHFEDALLGQHQNDLLHELGISDPDTRPCGELSLLQRKEILLCAACIGCRFTNLSLLLLDEPTNGLDVHGLIRLRQMIGDSLAPSATVVIVSHDVDLINDVATDIVDMCAKKLWYYPGNYDSYSLTKEQKESFVLKQSLTMERKAGRLYGTLQHLKEAPVSKRKGGSKKKAKTIASHRKKIERHEHSKKTFESQTAADAPVERRGLSVAQRLKLAEITKTVPDKAVQFVFPKVTAQWGEPLITAFDVGYAAKEGSLLHEEDLQEFRRNDSEFATAFELKREGFVFDCVDLCIDEGWRTCLLGPGGSTSCLMKILAKKLAPTEGTIHHCSGLTIGYCDGGDPTANLEDPNGFLADHPSATALEYLSDRYPNTTETDLRSHLAAFGLSPASQAKTALACLSGGETMRLVLATISMENPPVLCLEHPTSHLDVESVRALAHGLREWNGTLILVCQDASFLRSLEEVRCVVIVPEEGKIRRIVDDDQGGTRGMDAYLKTFQDSYVQY